MSINFCYEKLASIECQLPSSDDHKVTNLIATDLNRRRSGFSVDYFVKPPVEVVVSFKCRINLDRIVINCALGSQKSSVVQVFASCEESSEKSIAKETTGEFSKLFFHRKNSKFKKDLSDCSYHVFSNPWSLCNVSYIRIRILKTESSTVPCLGGLDIWGSISKSVQKEVFDSIIKIWKQINWQQTVPNSSFKPEEKPSTSFVSANTPVLSRKTNFEVPEEFLDALTFEVLTLPMTLPSGKVVDVRTLDKFFKVEEEHGRVPNDPFTGLPFTESRKPIVAATLKTRLDKFLLENCDQEILKDIPRTIGRKTITTAPVKSASYDPSSSSFGCGIEFKRCRDIDSMLESSLSGLPSFLEKPVEKKVKNDCIKCDSIITLFKLNCDHLVCRSCLVSLKKSECRKCDCGSEIDFSGIIRYHPDQSL